MFLLDTDFLIALTFPGESTHEKAKKLAEKYFEKQDIFYLDLVVQEFATVISRKYSQKEAIKTTQPLRVNSDSIIVLSSEEFALVWKLFDVQKNKKISFIDCANVVCAKSRGLKLLSFDTFYKKFPEILF